MNQLPEAAPRPWHALAQPDALLASQSTESGLSETEASARLSRVGPNQMRLAPPPGAFKILLDQLRSVVVLLLAAAAIAAFLLGDRIDAAAIGAVLLLNTLLGFVMEWRARRALAALLHLDVPRAAVVRAGRTRDVDARTLVPGDVIELEAGQLVPADARLLRAVDLAVVEAPLTGESIPVLKDADAVLPEETPLAERINLVYKATVVAEGRARALVFGTGLETEVGRIGGLVSALPEEKTPLERKLDQLGRRLVLVALGAAALLAVLGWARGIELGRILETALSLAVAAVPEGLPAIATITLALGVQRMARQRALVQRLPSVETLGAVTVICTDKTGTLTAGEVTATVLWLGQREVQIQGEGFVPEGGFAENGQSIDPRADHTVLRVLQAAVLANHADLTHTGAQWQARGDPTEIALLVAGAKAHVLRADLVGELPQVAEVPFSSERRWMATVHRTKDGKLRAFAKGAATTLVERCDRIHVGDQPQPLNAADKAAVLDADAELASRGLRVLALALGNVSGQQEAAVRGLTLVGLVGMIDPPALGVRDTIKRFREAGVRTVMITGDQQLTARSVAGQLGLLRNGDQVLDGSELERLSDAELSERLPHIAAFSRVAPGAKLRLVQAFQQRGQIVAMIGDGINDAAALRTADVGVAMGGRGTDVAKESAAVVLQDDRFQTIGAAIEEGRVIFDNIRKFVFYLFSCNLAELLAVLGASVVGWPLPLTPLQILWLNLVTDTFPALALAMEPAEPGVMQRPPRDPQQAILSISFLRTTTFYALLIAAVTLAALLIGLRGDGTPERARTLAFMTLALAQIFHLGNARSAGPVLGKRALTNLTALGAVLLVIALQWATIYFAPLAIVLRTVPLSGSDWLLVLALASLPALVGQLAHLRSQTRPRLLADS